MKTLLFSLLSFLTFAQTQLPDSVILVDGRTASCLITNIDESRVYFSYANRLTESVVLPALSKVYIESYGNVYSPTTGFNIDQEEVNIFLEKRLAKINKEQELADELKRINLTRQSIQPEQEIVKEVIEVKPFVKNKIYNKWSFGVLYVPYYSGNTYTIIENNSYPYYSSDVYSFSTNQTNLEAQLSYALEPELRITFETGYSASITDQEYENHVRYTSGSQYDSGNKIVRGLKKLDFSLGLKYYFNNFISNKVSIYTAVGFGKQLAFATYTSEPLYPPQTNPGVIDENNYEEALEDLNSPWHFNFGFGAEYFFNESLSLISNIRVLYTSSSANYESRYIDQYENRSSTEKFSTTDFVTRIGLGLNFYF